MVRLPQSDRREPGHAPRDENQPKVEGTTGTSITAPSNGNLDTSTKQPITFAAQPHRIIVNIPFFGRHLETVDPITARSANHRASSYFSEVLTNDNVRQESAKLHLTAKALHLVKTSHSSPSTRFRVNPSSKPRLVQPDKLKLSPKLKINHTARVKSRREVEPSPSPSPSPKADVEVKQSIARSPLSRRSRGRGDPRNAVMQEARPRFRQQERADEDARKTRASNVDSSVASPRRGGSHLNRTSASRQWNDYATRTSGQTLVRNPSQSLQKNAEGQICNRNKAHRALPPAQRTRAMSQRSNGGPIARRWDDWASWPEVRVKIFGLTPNITTADLWKCFSKEGTIITIELFEDSKGARDGKGQIRFR